MITFIEHPVLTRRITDLLSDAETIFLAYVFTKGEVEDLPGDKRKAIRRLVEAIKKEFER